MFRFTRPTLRHVRTPHRSLTRSAHRCITAPRRTAPHRTALHNMLTAINKSLIPLAFRARCLSVSRSNSQRVAPFLLLLSLLFSTHLLVLFTRRLVSFLQLFSLSHRCFSSHLFHRPRLHMAQWHQRVRSTHSSQQLTLPPLLPLPAAPHPAHLQYCHRSSLCVVVQCLQCLCRRDVLSVEGQPGERPQVVGCLLQDRTVHCSAWPLRVIQANADRGSGAVRWTETAAAIRRRRTGRVSQCSHTYRTRSPAYH